jgi:hypothetical protein
MPDDINDYIDKTYKPNDFEIGMKIKLGAQTLLKVNRGAKNYKLIFAGSEILLENELEEAMTISEKDLYDIIDEYFKREF